MPALSSLRSVVNRYLSGRPKTSGPNFNQNPRQGQHVRAGDYDYSRRLQPNRLEKLAPDPNGPYDPRCVVLSEKPQAIPVLESALNGGSMDIDHRL